MFDPNEVRRFITERKPLIPADLIELAEQVSEQHINQDDSNDKVNIKDKKIKQLKERILQLETELTSMREQQDGKISEEGKFRFKEEIETSSEENNRHKEREDKERISGLEATIQHLQGEINLLSNELNNINKQESEYKVIIKELQDANVSLKKKLEAKEIEYKNIKELQSKSQTAEWEKKLRLKIDDEYKERINLFEEDIKYFKEENNRLHRQLYHRPLPSAEESGDISFVQFEHLWSTKIKNRIEHVWNAQRIFWDFVTKFKNKDDILSFDTHHGKFLCPFCEKPFAKLVTMLAHAANEYEGKMNSKWSSLSSRHEAKLFFRDKSVEDLTEQYQKKMAKLIANPEFPLSFSLMPLIWALRMKGVEHTGIPIPMEYLKEEEVNRPIKMDWSMDGEMIVTPDMISEVVSKLGYKDEKVKKEEMDALNRFLFYEFFDRKKGKYKSNPFKKIGFKDFHYIFHGEEIPFAEGQKVPDPYDFLERVRYNKAYQEYRKKFIST